MSHLVFHFQPYLIFIYFAHHKLSYGANTYPVTHVNVSCHIFLLSLVLVLLFYVLI